ncbi:hypothetical protein N825_16255 [Skermanella stibiiresistens SB22]|uniref:Uncharacterized protein n=1 Tax=Skermanella stibiiresistens SB22 TaxID=1385369 RepID=W9GVM4_9PROT|nr:hypothetical protein [Skermanella stibiiresistens]EWY37955.1 hypothetical protein N825_16255 [Skermanella stibiiresistens SB22]
MSGNAKKYKVLGRLVKELVIEYLESEGEAAREPRVRRVSVNLKHAIVAPTYLAGFRNEMAAIMDRAHRPGWPSTHMEE